MSSRLCTCTLFFFISLCKTDSDSSKAIYAIPVIVNCLGKWISLPVWVSEHPWLMPFPAVYWGGDRGTGKSLATALPLWNTHL